MRILATLLISANLIAPCAWAETNPPPVPKNKSEALSKYSNQLNYENQAKNDLQKKIKTIQEDLGTAKEQLINIARQVQKNEKDMKSIEDRIANLETRKEKLNEQVNQDQRSIAKLITTLQRLRRKPPESLFVQNQNPYETAQSALIMGSMVPAINRHADKLRKTFQTLDEITDDLENQKQALQNKSKQLEKQELDLSSLLSKREILHKKLDQDIRIREINIQKISLKAKNLEELVSKIKKEEQEEEKRIQNAFLNRPKAKPKASEQAAFGSAQLPVSGVIRVGYNQKDTRAANSKGLTIEGRAASLVVAPIDGKVQFAGTFRRYGNIVIIEHDDEYHSLISGMGEISTIVGAHVKSGEPIGKLPNSSLNPRPTVYYELRRNGKPIDPAKKIAGLG